MRTTIKHLNSSHLPSQKKSLVAQTSLPRASVSVIALASIGALATLSPSAVWAAPPGVVLPAGTIPVLRGVANGVASYSYVPNTGGGQSATIHQTTPNVIINWDSFNIDKNSSVHFDQQGHATWAALNRIFDKDPSIIQGKLTADGQVYLINQNGILFDKGSQINVGALYASTLNITNERFLKGVQGADSTTTPMFEGGYDNDGNPTASPANTAGIRIGEFGTGAAPTINALSGGAIVMLAPMIKNVSGVITSPDGQVILAAGAKAYLYLNDSNISGSDLEKNRMRGMIVEVVADVGDVNVTSLIQNMGTLSADRGNVTLAGLMINQSGRASASTAVLQNGTVFLQGYSGGEKSTGNKKLYGKVVLSADSVTEAPLDKTDTTTATEDQKYYDLSVPAKAYDYRGYIKIEGNVIHNQGQIVAHGGNINLLAKKNIDDPAAVPRIYLDKGSKIDASGNWVDLNYDSNFVTFKVTSNELKDSPDQKAGALKGQTVTVDLRKGSTLLDVSGYQAGRKRTVQEKATTGGTITLASEGDLIARPDSVVDVSGGGYRYSGGVSKATRLIGADGQSYDIATAPKDLKYLGVRDSFTRTYKRWGQTETFKNLNGGLGVSESAYTEGKPGGELHLTALSGMVLDGNLYGGATAGVLQLANAPRGGYLEVGHYALETTQQILVNNVNVSAASQDTLGDGFQVDSALSDKAVNNLQISRTLFPASQQTAEGGYKQNGFDAVEINAKGSLTIASDVKIDAPLASTLTLRATQIDVAGKINAPAGNVKLESISTANADADLKRGIQLHQGAEIITKGAWINQNGVAGATVGSVMPSAFAAADRSASGTNDFSIAAGNSLNGGSVELNSNNTQLITEVGSKIDVSGGAKLSSAGKVTTGNGGKITLKTGSALKPGDTNFDAVKDYRNQLDGTFSGYGIGNGGKLIIEANTAHIGNTVDGNSELNFKPEFFQQGGFSSYDIKGKNALTIEDGSVIHPQQKNWVIDNQKSKLLVSGDDLSTIATLLTLPDDQRQATSIALRSKGYAGQVATSTSPDSRYATLNLPTTSRIVTDPKASVTLESDGDMLIQGQIIAPASNVELIVAGKSGNRLLPPSALTLDDTAKILVNGAYVAKPDDRGRLLGSVLDAGSVTLNTAQATIETKAGSLIDVSGAAQTLDVKQNDVTQSYVRKVVTSDAGSITIKSNDKTDLQGQMLGQAQGQSAGGSVSVQFSSRQDNPLERQVPNNSRIVVTEANTVEAVTDTQDLLVNTRKLADSGFDKLSLKADNSIEFQQSTNLQFKRAVTLDTAVLDIKNDQTQVIVNTNTATIANTGPGRRTVNSSGTLEYNYSTALINPTRAGTGKLDVVANTVNLHGDVTVNGVSETTIQSQNDIRLIGHKLSDTLYQGGLTSEGNITLQSAQLYPVTQSSYTFAVKKIADINDTTGMPVDGSVIKVTSNGNKPGEVLSVGGKVVLNAENIVQSGVIKAPLGTIELHADKSLELSSNSITSVSANGSVIPYGTTQAGSAWQDPAAQTIQSLPEKQIKLSGKSINQNTGATIDISGGGDVQAVEFVAGSGGSSDTLLKANTYAIMPKSGLGSVPLDASGVNTNGLEPTSTYNAIHLSAGSGVPEGDYILLPGRYALLPGAYMVQLQTGSTYSALKAGQTVNLRNGQTVVSGYLTVAGTDIRQSQPIGVIVRPGNAAKTESDYNINTGNEFFTKLATQNRVTVPRLPNDGGKLSIAATDALTLNGNFNTNPTNEKAQLAQVDISGQDNRIAVVDKVGRTDIASDYLQLDANSLSHLNASLLIGGTRSDATDATVVAAQSKEVLVSNNDASKLQAPELLLAAKENITVKSGSVLAGSGTKAGNSRNIKTDANSALIRLANNDQVTVDRGSNSGGGAGLVVVEEGATLIADKSLLIDATQNTQFKGNLQVQSGGSVALASSKVSMGETDGVTGIDDGLVLSNTQLANLNSLDTVALKSYGSVDLYGNTQLGSSALNNLSLDSGALVAKTGGSGGAANSQIIASNVTFKNTVAQASANTGTTGGVLNVNANKLTIGAGNKAIRGFDTVNMTATGDIVADGSKSTYDANGKLVTQPDSALTALQVAGNLTMTAARITGSHGAYQTWQAADLTDANNPLYYNLNIKGNGAATPVNDVTSIGSRLALEGKSITSNGRVEMKSGSVTMAAKGNGAADNVTLEDGAVVDVGGVSKNFNGTIAVVGAGVVNVMADTGNVVIKQGANVLVNGIADGGDAGTINIAANALQLDGQVNGAANAGQTQGKFNLDVQTLTDFSSLNSKLNSGSMTEQRTMRVRQGDVTIAAGDTVAARQLQIAADNGAINLNGKLDASSLKGKGKVELYAKNDVTLADGSVIDASSTLADSSAYSDGGTVRVGSTTGKVTFAQGARIDVSAAKLGKAGQVTFVAARNVGNDGMNADLQGTVLSKTRQSDKVAEVVAEANKVYDTTTFANAGTEVNTFVTAATAPAIVANIKGDDGQAQGNRQVRAGVELQVAGDHTQADAIDLTDATTWLSNNQPGTLTIRSQGNLNINSSIGLPSDSLYQADGVTPLGKTWNINLVGGADLGAANPMAVQTAKQLNQNIQAATITGGDVVLGANAKIRTGTGNIQVAAAHDFNMANGNNNTAVIYTTGQIAAADVATSYGSASNYGRWANQGGNISITAQHDAIGSGNQWITDWYRRPKANLSPANIAKLQADWWVYRANFKQNIGTFAGGDIQIQAGHDVGNLSAMSATSGRTYAGASQIEVLGGGDLLVQASNNIKGGSYLLGRGQGLIKAGGSVGSEQASQLYVMGESGSDVVAKQASLIVDAGNGVNLLSIANPTAIATDTGVLIKPISGVVDPSVGGSGLINSANFYTYSDNSQVSIKAKSGDIKLGGKLDTTLGSTNPNQQNKYANNSITYAYPATLLSTAFSGSILSNGNDGINSSIFLFASQQGIVKLLADQNVNALTLNANDTDPAALYSWRNPKKGTNSINVVSDDKPNTASRIVQRDQSGYVYDIQALNGGIKDSSFILPAKSRIWADKSIVLGNQSFELQNLKTTDISVIHSDKEDIRADTGTIKIGGPGQLVVQAGNSVFMPNGSLGVAPNTLGAITAIGNGSNANLTDEKSARLTVIAGVSGEVNLDKLDQAYADLIIAGQKNNPAMAKQAMDAFMGNAKILGGDINTYQSSIQTQGGSDIDLIAPKGNITVGSTTTPANNNVVGIVTTGGGAIRSYLSGDFNINQGKVLTARGGDVLIYTSDGGIDAGRGAKTARSTAAPKKIAVTVDSKDADGKPITLIVGYRYEIPVDAAGSGIQTATSDPDGSGPLKSPAPGSVYLFAPKGTIDAGEAGIVSAGNITIAAQTVLNATNISAAGSSQGVPQAVSGSLSSSIASSGATPTAGQDKAAEEAVKNAERSKMASVDSIKPNILSVEVVGFGDKNCKESDSSCFGK